MSSELVYKDVAVGADKDAAVTVTGAYSASDTSRLPFGVGTPVLSLLEHNYWMLDGSRTAYDGQAMAFMSAEVSGADGTFSTPPKIRIDFDSNYTTLGIYLSFSKEETDFCKQVTITWYQGETQLAHQVFNPDSTSYFCEKTVSAFNRVDISLDATAVPGRRARLDRILFGIVRRFLGGEIGSVTIQRDVNPISAEVPISYLDWALRSASDTDYIFQLKQPVEAYHDGKLLGVFYVDAIPNRTGENAYSVECQDALGVLDGYDWPGKVYTENTAFPSVISEIINGVFDVEIPEALTSANIKGLIPSGTRRDALRHAAFAAGAAVDTSGTEKIRFFIPDLSNSKEIPKGETFSGGSMKQEAIVTAVVVTYHAYAEGEGSSGDETVEVNGTKYVHTTGTVRIDNPNVTPSDKQNIKTVEDATLVNAENAQAVAQRVYDYWMRRNTLSTAVVWEDLGMLDYVSVKTPWMHDVEGVIKSAKITLSNLTAASIEVLS